MGGEVDAGGEFDALEELSAMSVVSVTSAAATEVSNLFLVRRSRP